jgi:uncharacterized membrane protein
MNLISRYWDAVSSSFWFLPGLIVTGATLLALFMVELDARWVERDALKDWPRLFAAGAEASRELLGVVATSMITVAGTVFSITLVALSLASSQYSSRVLRNFMRDRTNQMVLGVFVGIFAYCLVVLRTIHDRDETAFLPTMSVLLGMALGFVGIAFLVFFIHHISTSIQASQILAAVRRETNDAIDRLFPRSLASADDVEADDPFPGTSGQVWQPVMATASGYLQRVDIPALVAIACARDSAVHVRPRVGDFVIEGTIVCDLRGSGALDEETRNRVRDCWAVGPQRTLQQDVAFGIRQMVDVALKALSPGINDSTTAMMCIDNLTAVLLRLADRDLHLAHCRKDGQVRVSLCHPAFDAMLGLACDQIREHAAGNVAVLERQRWSLEVLAQHTRDAGRRKALQRQAERLLDTVSASRGDAHASVATEGALRMLLAQMRSG